MLGLGGLWWALSGGLSAPLRPPLPEPKIPDPNVIPPSSGTRYTGHLSDAFLRAVDAFATDMRARGAGITAEDVLGVLKAESGIQSTIKNGIGCAGMNQICNLSQVGWPGGNSNRDAYLKLNPEDQWPWVEKWFRQAASGKEHLLANMGRLYLLNFNPGNIDKPDNFVLYRARPDGPDPRTGSEAEWTAWTKSHSSPGNQDVYALNRGVDVQKKGFIEVADMDRFVKRSLAWGPKGAPEWAFWSELKGRLNAARGPTVAGISVGPYAQTGGEL